MAKRCLMQFPPPHSHCHHHGVPAECHHPSGQDGDITQLVTTGPEVAIKRVSQERISEWARMVSERGQWEEPAECAGRGPAGRQRGQRAWSEWRPRSAPGQVMASHSGAGQGLPEAQCSISPADGIAVPPQHKGTLVPLKPALLWKVLRPGFCSVMQLLDWFEVPEAFALLMERLQRCQHLWYFLHERQFLTEPVARGLFCQVLEAVRCCSSRSVLCHHIKAENALIDLATGEAKLLNFGCSTILQDTFYTQMSGTSEYSPPEWILFGCYHGQPATIWSLGILLCELVCGHLPFHTNEDIVQGQLFFPARVSQECQHLIRWCLCMDPTDRPSLEDLFEHSWLQEPCLAQEAAEMHPCAHCGGSGSMLLVPLEKWWQCDEGATDWDSGNIPLQLNGIVMSSQAEKSPISPQTRPKPPQLPLGPTSAAVPSETPTSATCAGCQQ
ncbi:serine/threonine-protein kinase pim-1-like [Melozone crissalis]|uniref:serine/threonine-protein kinase pim-1-like n=1 Tax=Melozone crissalis TaxID=40204 RepID=UPI0023DAECCE|nr:serine/threonine-protein kinase pim-1-like [Melozone crissalis]